MSTITSYSSADCAMPLSAGEHHVRIALPGYLPFETTVDLRPYQVA
ncbi:MAG: hypothetical protein DMG76_34680 [Acidobacteria bacterium]|nr:MAG: hypothetical protein DMG76_34680 [Acidobacteriota bacterium]